MTETTTLKQVRDFLADPAHWARKGGGDGKTTACIITAASLINTSWLPVEIVRKAIKEWYVANPAGIPSDQCAVPSIVDFNDRYCPDHATLLKVLDRAIEIEAATTGEGK